MSVVCSAKVGKDGLRYKREHYVPTPFQHVYTVPLFSPVNNQDSPFPKDQWLLSFYMASWFKVVNVL